MKNLTFIVVVAIALSATISCNPDTGLQTDEIKVIDLAGAVGRGKVVKISEVADEIKYVALETTDSSLIGMGAKVQIENGRIYVRSRYSNYTDVKIFDMEGKYLFTFNRTGRGPEEYSPMSRIEIDPVTGGFMVFDIIAYITNPASSNWSFKEYDKEGNYLRKIDVPRIDPGTLQSVRRLDENIYVSTVGSESKEPVKIHGAAFDSLSNIVFEIPLAKMPEYLPKEVQNEYISIGEAPRKDEKRYNTMPPSILMFKHLVRLVNPYNDTIFTLDKSLNYYPSFVINYGNYINTSPNREGISGSKGDHINIDPLSYVESERYIIMNFIMRDYAHEPYNEYIQARNRVITVPRVNSYAVYDKQTGFFNLMNQPVKGKLGFQEDIKNGPPFLPGHINAIGFATSIISAVQLIEHAEVYEVKDELKEIVSKLKDTDNPIVAIAKFR